jgi:hypothetical protein
MTQSRSWRMTGPLRAVMGAIRERRAALGGGRIPLMLRGAAKRALAPAVRLAMRSPKLKQVGIRVLATRPMLKVRLQRLVHAAPPMPKHLDYGWKGGRAASSGDLPSELPEPARPIYAELQERYSASGRGMQGPTPMRIVLDLQSAQAENRNRGIGRYSVNLAEAMVRRGHRHEIVIALNGAFEDMVEPIREHFRDLVPPQHFRVWSQLRPTAGIDEANRWRVQASELVREHALCELAPDLVHTTSLFEGAAMMP